MPHLAVQSWHTDFARGRRFARRDAQTLNAGSYLLLRQMGRQQNGFYSDAVAYYYNTTNTTIILYRRRAPPPKGNKQD